MDEIQKELGNLIIYKGQNGEAKHLNAKLCYKNKRFLNKLYVLD